MNTFTLLDAVTAVVDGAETRLQADPSAFARDEATVQVAITGGTATVLIEGRISPAFPWVQLGAAISASALVPVSRLPYMRARVTARSGSTISAAVFA